MSKNASALDGAFETLNTYDYGASRPALGPIDDAVLAGLKDPAAGRTIEARLAAVLKSDAPAAAKDYACRKLAAIGSAASIPVLAPLLSDKRLSVAARMALEQIPGDEASKALRDGLPKLTGAQKVGAINSLGVRRDASSLAPLAALLKDADAQIASAAAAALGNIGTTEAAKALRAFVSKTPKAARKDAANACLECAELLLKESKSAEARSLYQALATSNQPQYVQQAAKRGLAKAG